MQIRPYYFQAAILLLMVGLYLPSFPGSAQEGVADATIPIQVVESRIAEIQASTDMVEAVRARLLDDYRKTIGFLETAKSYTDKANAYAQARESAPAETRKIRERLEKATADTAELKLDLAEGASAQEIEARLQTEQANQAAVSAKFSSLGQQLAAESNRPRVIRERLLVASKLGDKLAADLKSSVPSAQSQLVSEARDWALSAQTTATHAEIRMLDQELLSQPARISLLQAQRDSSARTLTRIDSRILLLEELLTSQRRNETRKIIAEFDTAVVGQVANHPLIRAFAQESIELSEYLQTLTDHLEEAEAAAREDAVKLKDVQLSFQTAQQRLEIAGLSQALGQVLHKQRRDLPDLRDYRQRSRKREQIIAQTGLRDIQLEAERKELQDVPKYITDQLAEVPEAERDELAGPMLALVSARSILLGNVITVNNDYLRALGELDFQESQLQATVSDFNSFLVERLLWVRNKGAVGLKTVLVLPGEILDFIDPRPWLDAVKVLQIGFSESPLLWLAFLTFGVLIWKKGALRDARRATAKSVGRPAADDFTSTARALGITILLALPWPLLSFAVGWELSLGAGWEDGLAVYHPYGAKSIGIALERVSRFLFFLSVFREICASGGLAEAHFKWPPSATRALRVQLDQLLLTFMLPAFAMITAIQIHPEDFGGELARALFLIVTTGLLMFVIRVLRPHSGILDTLRHAHGSSGDISWLWLVLGAAIPAVFAIATLAGYMYSATTLMSLLINSLWLVLALVIAHELAARWLLVVGGRLQLKVAIERREAARALRAKQAEAPASGEVAPLPIEDHEIDVASIDADTRKLLRLAIGVCAFIGMGAIWSSVLPALTLLQDYTLWEYLDGPVGQQQLVPVTLADFLLMLVYIFVSIVAARTVPSLVEAILRQRDSVTAGTRVAFATLARYSIVVLGISLVANTIGFNWSEIQWLVAALGVGIGFGLQEIIANFISGIIILIERPIRVGDLVTVGDTSGTVTRLQIRATTVTNFDRQELLVPNKEFITGRVLNWSLSDEVIRLVVNVGVAYGSDMPKALTLVKEAVDEHEVVLKDPPPLITFDSFGDNSLNITARCFIGSLNRRREVASDLNMAVNRKLNEAGIVIAFPQRDVHLDTSSPLDIRIQHAQGLEELKPAKTEP